MRRWESDGSWPVPDCRNVIIITPGWSDRTPEAPKAADQHHDGLLPGQVSHRASGPTAPCGARPSRPILGCHASGPRPQRRPRGQSSRGQPCRCRCACGSRGAGVPGRPHLAPGIPAFRALAARGADRRRGGRRACRLCAGAVSGAKRHCPALFDRGGPAICQTGTGLRIIVRRRGSRDRPRPDRDAARGSREQCQGDRPLPQGRL